MLQPTSPLRNTSDLLAVVELLQKNLDRCEAVASVTELTSTHPDKVQKIVDGYLKSYIPGVTSERPRQELPLVYRLNGAFYLTHATTILKEKTLLPKRTLPYIMPMERSINLDTMMDIYILEALLEKGVVELEEY
jgi:CMP-N-acetylneuraminic acid synthetase